MKAFRKGSTKNANSRVSSDYSDFLPAALEIVEKPASPVRFAFIWFICIVAASALIWSFVGRIDVVATAQGKIQPSGRVKIVQSTISGRVVSAPFPNGVEVKTGELLVKLDDVELRAEATRFRTMLESLEAEQARRLRELATVEAHDWSGGAIISTEVSPDYPDGTSSTVQYRESAILKANLLHLKETMSNLGAQTQLQSATISRLDAMASAQQKLISTLTERVSMRSGLVERAAGRKADVLDARQALQEEEATLSTYTGQLVEARASLIVSETEKNKALSTFVADNVQKLGDLARKIDEVEQELVKAEKRLASTSIYAPSDGIVHASSITTTGQVISAETEIMRIVPAASPLEIEVFLANQDVGFVRPGQSAIIKIETFPFTRYGVLTGKVKSVARDAIPNPDAQAMEEQAAPQFRSVVPGANVQRLQNLVYPATVTLDATEIDVDGTIRPLSPGMAVSVEIKTAKRRIIDYFWSPVAQVASEAMQER